MDFAALKDAVIARGFNFLDDQRLSVLINRAVQDLCDEEDWPFLRATATGTAPLTITDARRVLSVTSALGELEGRDENWVRDEDPQFDQTGTPREFWHDATLVKVWPLDASTVFTVRYLKTPLPLVHSSDVPIIPERFHPLIADYAVIRALRDRSNYADADAAFQALRVDLDRMRDVLLGQEPVIQRITDPCTP